MENAMKTDKLLVTKRKVLFNCADTIESLKCFQCANFKTHNLVHLNYHSKAGHTLPESEEKLCKCESCDFLTYSKFLSLTHQSLTLCTGSKKVKSNKTPSKSISNPHHKYGKNKLSKCKHCPHTAKTPQNLRRHILFKHTHLDKIHWFQCAQCLFKFKTKSCLNKHMDLQHGNTKLLRCDQCPYRSNQKSNLKKHVDRLHADQILLRCDHCPFMTKHERFLRNHIQWKHTDQAEIHLFKSTHGNKATLKCDQESLLKCDRCPFETKHEGFLKHHILSNHTDAATVQWFECAQCPFKSHREISLQKHINSSVHANKAKLKCDQCEFETTSKRSLARHLLSKYSDPDEIKWFCCEHCSYESTMKEDLLQHKDMHHQAKTQYNIK